MPRNDHRQRPRSTTEGEASVTRSRPRVRDLVQQRVHRARRQAAGERPRQAAASFGFNTDSTLPITRAVRSRPATAPSAPHAISQARARPRRWRRSPPPSRPGAGARPPDDGSAVGPHRAGARPKVVAALRSFVASVPQDGGTAGRAPAGHRQTGTAEFGNAGRPTRGSSATAAARSRRPRRVGGRAPRPRRRSSSTPRIADPGRWWWRCDRSSSYGLACALRGCRCARCSGMHAARRDQRRGADPHRRRRTRAGCSDERRDETGDATSARGPQERPAHERRPRPSQDNCDHPARPARTS